MIINIRGTNGSGKSTVVRQLIACAEECRPLYGALGARSPEAYCLQLEDLTRSVFVLGPYVTETGGCDAVHPYSLILELLDKYVVRGHVVFEGSLVSDNYGRVGEWLEVRGKDAVMAFMDTPLEECLRRVQGRRLGRGNVKVLDPQNTTRRYESVQKVWDRVTVEGIIRALLLPSEDAARVVAAELYNV